MSAWLCGNKTLSCVVDIIKSNDFKKNYDIANEYCNKEKNELIDILSDLNIDDHNMISNSNIIKCRNFSISTYISSNNNCKTCNG